MKKIFYKITTLFVAFFLICVATATKPVLAADAPSDPARTITLLQQAVDKRDSKSVEQYIDLNSTVEKAVAVIVPALNKAAAQGQIRMEPTLGALLAGINSSNATAKRATFQLITSETRKFILYGVKSGSFAGKPEPINDDGGIFMSMGGIDTSRKEFLNPKVLQKDDNKALVGTTLKNHYDNSLYHLVLNMELQGGDTKIWRIVSVQNAQDLINMLFL